MAEKNNEDLVPRETRQKIVDEILKRAPDLSCPMCRSKDFIIVDGFFGTSLQKNTSSIAFGGNIVPSACLVCKNCGFMSQHALGALGMLNISSNNEPQTSENKIKEQEV